MKQRITVYKRKKSDVRRSSKPANKPLLIAEKQLEQIIEIPQEEEKSDSVSENSKSKYISSNKTPNLLD